MCVCVCVMGTYPTIPQRWTLVQPKHILRA